MLNRGLGGAYGFSTDIGGYEDVITGAELLLRWAEWSVLSPTFRLPGSAGQGTHVPWSYDAATLAAYKAVAQLREQVAPLVGRLWAQSATTGMPLTTPLWLAYPDDPVAATQDEEWLLGPDILAAPVVVQDATTRTAYLPAGCWTYMPTGIGYEGMRSVTVPAPLDTLSWFTRCGTNPLNVTSATVTAPQRTTSASQPKHPVGPKAARPGRRRQPARQSVAVHSGSLAATGGLPLTAAAVSCICGALVVRRRRRHAGGW